MSNNKQSMKLYTEEQVKQMLFDLGDVLFNNCQNGIKEEEPKAYFDGIIESSTPIELPSDDEIENYARQSGFVHPFITRGAKFVIDKIQGGNSEQQ